LLKNIKTFFKDKGNITFTKSYVKYRIRSSKDVLDVLIPHFDKHPMQTDKQADYLLFKSAALKIIKGEHLSLKGLQDIINIRATIN